MGDLEGSAAGLLISVERGILLYSVDNDRPGHLEGYNGSRDLVKATYGVQRYDTDGYGSSTWLCV